MENRVVITGLNMITSLGLNLDSCWGNILSGKSGVKEISLFDASNLLTKIAAEVPREFDDYYSKYIKKRIAKQMSRVTRFCYTCAMEAVEHYNIDFDVFDKERCAVILGVVNTGCLELEGKDSSKDYIVLGMNNALSAWIAQKFKIAGPNYTVSTACASSAYAISQGYDLIKSGRADIVVVGGADSTINPYDIEGFNKIYALSVNNEKPEKACRPFTKDRDGFVIGEGAGILILESEESAKKRGVPIIAELAGTAMYSESYNIMAPMKDGVGMARCMELALKNARTNRDDVDYINAHGTSTILNDKFETMAIKKVFEEQAYKIPVSSTKSMTGHTIGAAGVIEAIISIMSIIDNKIPPTINYDNPDEELDLDYVPNQAREQEISCVISNSFAFGGHNATLVLKKYK